MNILMRVCKLPVREFNEYHTEFVAKIITCAKRKNSGGVPPQAHKIVQKSKLGMRSG